MPSHDFSRGMKKLFILAVVALVLIGPLSCGKRLSDKQKKTVYNKTVQDLVFVKGGSFMMGDGGATFTDKNRRKFKSSVGWAHLFVPTITFSDPLHWWAR